MSRDRSPFRYILVHVKDVARIQVLLYAVVAFGLAFVARKIMGSAGANSLDVADLLRTILNATLMIAILMAAGGVAGNDRKQGFYRAFFSKPMAPWWYYLQRWLVGLAAVLTIPLWLALAFQLVFGKGSNLTFELFGSVALAYLLIGGAVLLFSTVTARDWLVVFLLYFMQRRMQEAQAMLTRMGQEVPRLVDVLVTILPPFDVTASTGTMPNGHALLHVVLYGVAMVVIALVVLIVRPLGSGGRA